MTNDRAGADLMEPFLAFSAEVTAFSVYELHGTGQAEPYLDATLRIAGAETLGALLAAYAGARDEAGDDAAALEDLLRRDIFSNDRLGPVARNVLKLWYIGTWYELPAEWNETYGGGRDEGTFVVTPAAYTEGLAWRAIGANPPGAKGPGFGTWADPPRITDV